MKHRLTLLIATLLLILLPVMTLATEDIAEKTGKDCSYCHLDPSGGGELTLAGQGYLLSLTEASVATGSQTQTNTTKTFARLFKLLIDFIHLFTGIFWFGTILYVHLILKPAYASKGLPRGEVKLGLISIVIMAITGLILTSYRVPNLEFFFTTRFGILLFIKICVFCIMAGSAMIAVFIVGPRLQQKKELTGTGTGEMTAEELGAYDGQEGRPAYFAYRGKVYDASNSKLWKNGSHMVRHAAGVDLTTALPQAPHGEDKVFDMPEVGTLIASRTSESKGLEPKQVFYFMAYMNLVNVFLVVVILALWRW
jgi:predicted heme/steroid binding protein